MITPQEAEKLAHDTIEQYVNTAECRSVEDVANVLMKLASMAGLAMAAVVGREEAGQRMSAAAWNAANATISKDFVRVAVACVQSGKAH